MRPVLPLLLLAAVQPDPAPDAAAVRAAVSLYASFDDAVVADFARGDRHPRTRFNHATEKGRFVHKAGYDATVMGVVKRKGISGPALEVTDVQPRNGRMYFPAKGNLAVKAGGWGGSVSVWCKTDPDKLLKTSFCDPVQITQKGANNGGLWFDFNDAKPRDLRHGAFPAVPDGQKGIAESDPAAPLVRVPAVGWKADDWHHVALTWVNLDTGRPDAVTALYIDGRLIGGVTGRALAMNWDVEQTGVYVAVGYIGLLDELALFDRPLTPAEVALLHRTPALLAPLKPAP